MAYKHLNFGLTSRAQLQIARDKKLVKKLLSGDAHAFQQFIDEYLPRLYRFARSRLDVEADVEDVVQVTFVKSARSLSTYRGEATLLAWLKGICTNETNSQLAKKLKRREIEIEHTGDGVLTSVVESIEASTADDPEEAVRRAELRHLIVAALDELPDNYAEALEMKYISGCSYSEIADHLGISQDALKSLMARAREAFRETFTEDALSALKLVRSPRDQSFLKGVLS